MATLTQSKTNKSLLVYAYKETSEIVIAATHITHYVKLPDNSLLIHNASGSVRLKFVDLADRDAAIVILDATMNLTLTQASISV